MNPFFPRFFPVFDAFFSLLPTARRRLSTPRARREQARTLVRSHGVMRTGRVYVAACVWGGLLVRVSVRSYACVVTQLWHCGRCAGGMPSPVEPEQSAESKEKMHRRGSPCAAQCKHGRSQRFSVSFLMFSMNNLLLLLLLLLLLILLILLLPR